MAKFLIFFVALSTCILHLVRSQCTLEPSLVEEIRSYEHVVKQIIEKVVNGDFKGKLFDDTAAFVDTVGARVVGSPSLDYGIDYILDWMRAQNFDDVHGEEIVTPNWIRGNESLEMIEPRYQRISILGYGKSVSTSEPIEAEIVVVRDYEELEERASEVPGKIVVYDHRYVSYDYSVMYRYSGAMEAAKRGAVAALVAAISDIAMGLPHTGQMGYDEDESIPRIPLASISIDSAQMLGRMHRRGNTIKLRLIMEDELPGDVTSRNTFGQLTGSVYPDENIIVSGHIDSWDVGQGAIDDGAAVVMAALVITLLKDMQLTPKRTIQAVGWTAEENGFDGVQQYIQQHLVEINAGKIAAAFESDTILSSPLGYGFAGSDEGACIVQEILKLFQEANFTSFTRSNRVGADVAYLSDLGVPTFNFATNIEKYFWYHHAESDTMTAMDTDELDKCLAVFAASVYVVADLSQNLANRSPEPTDSLTDPTDAITNTPTNAPTNHPTDVPNAGSITTTTSVLVLTLLSIRCFIYDNMGRYSFS